MKDLLDKLSSYNIFNYLFPGVLFALMSGTVTGRSFLQQDLVTGVFLYYLLGLIVSRFGSLVIEPLLKQLGFVRHAPYSDFVVASKKNPGLAVLSEVNNMYRTLCALFALLLLMRLYETLGARFPSWRTWELIVVVVVLMVVFAVSYRKQSDYVRKTVEADKLLAKTA